MSSISNVAANSTVNTATTGSSSPDLATTQDRFLKLLVAQLNNQDPMNPMDNAQMTSQMAQINTVTGISQLNETMKAMASQSLSMQILQGASLVGHDVLVTGNTLTSNNGVTKGAVELPGSADKVTVEIMTPGGQVLDTLNLGAQAEGRHNFEWNSSAYQGEQLVFRVTATRAGQDISASPLTRDNIVSVGNENGVMNLQLKAHSNVAYSDIKAIF